MLYLLDFNWVKIKIKKIHHSAKYFAELSFTNLQFIFKSSFK